MSHDTPLRRDRRLQQRLERGEAAALGELYDRHAPLVHSLAHRVLEDEAAAALTTREVFVHVWEHPDDYDPGRGSLRAWIADLAQQHATARLRRRPSTGGTPEAAEARVREVSAIARADYIVGAMPGPLRDALKLAHFQRKDYRETAERLGVSAEEARRRLRLGLQLLSTAVVTDLEFDAPPRGRTSGAETGR